MYLKTGELQTGFEVYRCVRGGSALEGQHLHYRMAEHVAAKSAGLLAANARMNLFDYEWNVRAAFRAPRDHRGYRTDVGCTELWLIDAIHRVAHIILEKTAFQHCIASGLALRMPARLLKEGCKRKRCRLLSGS